MHRLVIALVTFIGLVGAVVVAGWLLFFSTGTDRAAALAPANTAVYVNVYLQPSTGQQMNLAELIGRLPGFADDASLDEKVDRVVQNLLSGSGIDYLADVKPWLGDQVAIAAWPGADDPAAFEAVLIAEVRDREAADASVPNIVGADGASFTSETYEGIELNVTDGGAYAFVGDMLVIGGSSEHLRAVVDVQAGAGSLAARSEFRAAVDELPQDHLASAFVDITGIAAAGGASDDLPGASTGSAVLVAEPSGLRISGSAPLDGATPVPSGSSVPEPEAATLAEWMPSDSIAGATFFGVRQLFEQAEESLGSAPGGEDVASALSTLRAIAAFALGINIDEDVLPLLEGEVGVALSGIGEGGLPSGQLVLRPDDAEAARTLLDGLVERLAAVGALVETETVAGAEVVSIELPDTGSASYAVLDGVVVLGFSADDVRAAVEAHDGESLAGSAAYEAAFEPIGGRAGSEVYVDVAALVDALGGSLELSEDGRDILSRIGTFALTIPSRPDQIEFHAALTVTEPGAE
jgi:hypothetical protein